jgi:hypothetical protein
MEATAEKRQAATRKEYKSPASALRWCFERSRYGWKNKYMQLKATVKGFKNRIVDLTKSREEWRNKAEQASQRCSVFEVENANLRALIAALEDKKKRNRSAAW